ncbi:MAG: ABC transporter substrate-binding protein [Acidobacteriota bacterium]
MGLLALLVSLPSAPGWAEGVGVVKTAEISIFDRAVKAFEKELGGSVHEASLDSDRGRWPKVSEQLKKKEVDVWVPLGPLALEMTSQANTEQPVVFMMVFNPAKSLPASSKNVAGVTMRVSVDVQLEEIRRLLPDRKKVGVIHDPTIATSAADVARAREIAPGLGLEVLVKSIGDSTELGSALNGLLADGIDVLWLVVDRTVTPPRDSRPFEFITETTGKAGVPIVGYAPRLAKAGALLALGPDYDDIGAQAAEIVTQVQAGTAPADIGVQNARKFALSVNQKVAKTLGITLAKKDLADAEIFN